MAQLKFGSAGVTANEIDISGPLTSPPVGTPAGIVGTALNGPAFVPVTVGTLADWYSKFGETDGKKFGPLAVVEWMRRAQAVTYLRVLGVGDGKERLPEGSVNRAGFIVGEQLPNPIADVPGAIGRNPYANNGGILGRTYFLGCFMSESAGSTIFSDAGLQGSNSGIGGLAGSADAAVPIIRGVLMAPSGVILTLSSTVKNVVSDSPASSFVANEQFVSGSQLGDVVLGSANSPKQEFVLLLNGHQGLTASYPNVITASFDATSNNYFVNKLNTDPHKIQEAGHYLYASWDIHPVLAVVTGTKTLAAASGSGATGWGREPIAFIVSGSGIRKTFDATKPNYENFQDRFGHAKSPWFISQKFGGKAVDLFKLHALDDGAGPSSQFKISIENILPSSDPLNRYGSFNVVLREFSDRDLEKKPLANEVFNGVNLDPSSDRYIAKVIGDVHAYYDFDREESAQKLVIEGNYENRSNYVRVEVHPDVENGFIDPTALPLGFRGVDHILTSGSAPLPGCNANENDALGVDNAFKHAVTPPLPFRKKVTINAVDTVQEQAEPKFYWGVQFEHPQTLAKLNGSTLPNDGIKSYTKYFPDFADGFARFLTGSNSGQPDTADWGIADADRFCNNLFTLENVQVVTGTTELADFNKWKSAVYVRGGNITPNAAAKTRALKTDDFLSNKAYIKYTTIMQGGFNGVNIFDADSEEINNAAVHADMDSVAGRGLSDGPNVKAYMKALDIMKNVVNMDIQLLAIPGIREPIVTDAAVLAVEERFDALYIMDIEQLDESSTQVEDEDQIPSVTNTINNFKNRTVDTSFAAAYFPDVLYRDPKGINLQVPPSVLVMGAMALNDAVGHPWFAPAGFTRGALPAVALEPRVKLSQRDMDTLYDNSVNPLVAFPSQVSSLNPQGGIVIWGQKTLQVAASALDRVNVRRLLIEIRRQVRDIANSILFEPNREATLARFSASVTPRLQRIQALSGLERFRVIIDSSTTTQDDIENNTIRGKIFVQPTKSIEFVSLDFVVANNLQQVQ